MATALRRPVLELAPNPQGYVDTCPPHPKHECCPQAGHGWSDGQHLSAEVRHPSRGPRPGVCEFGGTESPAFFRFSKESNQKSEGSVTVHGRSRLRPPGRVDGAWGAVRPLRLRLLQGKRVMRDCVTSAAVAWDMTGHSLRASTFQRPGGLHSGSRWAGLLGALQAGQAQPRLPGVCRKLRPQGGAAGRVDTAPGDPPHAHGSCCGGRESGRGGAEGNSCQGSGSREQETDAPCLRRHPQAAPTWVPCAVGPLWKTSPEESERATGFATRRAEAASASTDGRF